MLAFCVIFYSVRKRYEMLVCGQKEKHVSVFRERLTNNNVSAHKRNKVHVHLTIFGKETQHEISQNDYFLILSMYAFIVCFLHVCFT